MRNVTRGFAGLAVAAAIVGGAAIVPTPAAAQSQWYEPYDSGPYGGPYGWQGRAARDRLGSDMDGYGREQFERGYRTGREDERRGRADSSGGQDARAAMEFLDHARQQMERGDLRSAWVALSRAETRLATRSLPPGAEDEAAAGAAVGAVRAARRALQERDVDLALARTERAMNLAQRGAVVGRNVPGSALSGAGSPGPGMPMSSGGGRGGGRGPGSDQGD